MYNFDGKSRRKETTGNTKTTSGEYRNGPYIGWDGMVWIDLTQERDHRQALLHM
jgi:hypothetical protein